MGPVDLFERVPQDTLDILLMPVQQSRHLEVLVHPYSGVAAFAGVKATRSPCGHSVDLVTLILATTIANPQLRASRL